jgi:hypothetical protein
MAIEMVFMHHEQPRVLQTVYMYVPLVPKMIYTIEEQLVRWAEHFEGLLNRTTPNTTQNISCRN